MKRKLANLVQNFKFQTFLVFAVSLFFYRLFFSPASGFPWDIINETLVVLTFASFTLYLLDLMRLKTINPLSLVMNMGILNGVIFFLITFSDGVFSTIFPSLNESIKSPGIVYTFVSYFYVFLLITSLSYMFLSFRELHYLKQKRNVSNYFLIMSVFFLLASVSTISGQSYITNTFFILSILLIVLNSIRISWIAFLTKKEKFTLLGLSILISALFVFNLLNNDSTTLNSKVVSGFSPSLNQFLNLMMTYGIIYFSILFFTTLFHLPTAEAFDRKAQEVSSLQYFSKLITQVLDFNELVETITEIGVKLSEADAAWILWKEGTGYKTYAQRNIGYLESDSINNIVINGSGSANISSTTLYNLNNHPELAQPGNKYVLAVSPLRTHNEVKGYLMTVKKSSFIFDDEDLNALNTFSDYASVAIENSRLLEESIEKERLEKELDVAREIQRKILPAKNPENEKLEISSVFIPAFEVGGDYYDYFEISEDKFAFIIADVSGKGISAAFIMAEIKGIFESLARTGYSPKQILIKANSILQRTLDRKTFVSAAYGLLDMKTGRLTIARAGHCPVILLRDKQVTSLRPSGLGLGLTFTGHFGSTLEEAVIDLKENDLIVLYTDGITEAKNKEMEDFGSDAFERILIDNSGSQPDEISNKVIREVTLFSTSNTQHDDITLVILKWKQKININGVKEWQISAPQLKI